LPGNPAIDDDLSGDLEKPLTESCLELKKRALPTNPKPTGNGPTRGSERNAKAHRAPKRHRKKKLTVSAALM
jgi:hypothetical protein